MEEIREYPKPLHNYVVIKNPLLNITEETDKIIASLPPDEKEAYAKKTLNHLWAKIEVVAVGDRVTSFKAKDLVAIDIASAQHGYYVGDTKYIILRDTAIFGVW